MTNKRLVVIKNGNNDGTETLADALSACGWQCETIELAKGEPLPKSLHEIDGLLVLGRSIDVLERSTNPMQVYIGS